MYKIVFRNQHYELDNRMHILLKWSVFHITHQKPNALLILMKIKNDNDYS